MHNPFAQEGGQITRFFIVGSFSVFVYYALLYGLTEYAGIWYVISAAVAFVIYFAVNFASQKWWAFRNTDKRQLNRQLAQFTAMAVANWILNTSLLYLLVEYAGLWYMLAQAILTIVVSIIAYIGFRYIFRRH